MIAICWILFFAVLFPQDPKNPLINAVVKGLSFHKDRLLDQVLGTIILYLKYVQNSDVCIDAWLKRMKEIRYKLLKDLNKRYQYIEEKTNKELKEIKKTLIEAQKNVDKDGDNVVSEKDRKSGEFVREVWWLEWKSSFWGILPL